MNDRLLYRPETVFVTGASSGIGAATARRFAADGCRLILLARRADRLGDLVAELGREFGGAYHTIVADVTDRPTLARELDQLPARFAAVDVLVNSAGLALGLAPFQSADPEDLERMIDVNVTALVRVTRQILPGMVARKRGHIINLGSVAGSYPYPGGHVYGGTKAFVKQFSLALRADLLGTDVRVTNIEPGMVETEFSVVRFKGDRTKADTIYAGANPLVADDIADIVHWVATRPAHVNINRVEVMPPTQATGSFAVHRET